MFDAQMLDPHSDATGFDMIWRETANDEVRT
jgi:hypothetical protein